MAGEIKASQISSAAVQSILSTTLTGSSTFFDDVKIESENTRNGIVAPTKEGGFKGDANAYVTNFVHNQADEVQFSVQFDHRMLLGSKIYPHVHFSPFTALGAGTYAAQFIMSYYWGGLDVAFEAVQTYTMTKTWSGEKQWYHFLAGNVAGITPPSSVRTLSSMMHVRLYRDNGVTNNFAGKVTFLEFDMHVEIDQPGSREEFVK